MFCEDVMVATMAAILWPWGRTNGIAYASVWSPDIAKSLNKCFLLNGPVYTCVGHCWLSDSVSYHCRVGALPKGTLRVSCMCVTHLYSLMVDGRDLILEAKYPGKWGCQQGMDLDRKIKLPGENARLINSLKPTVVNTVGHKNTQKANEQGSRGQQWQHELVCCAKARQTSHGRGPVQI